MTSKITNIYIFTQQGKPTPIQAWTGPEVSTKSKLQDFKRIGR
jgi:hypothetical protein